MINNSKVNQRNLKRKLRTKCVQHSLHSLQMNRLEWANSGENVKLVTRENTENFSDSRCCGICLADHGTYCSSAIRNIINRPLDDYTVFPNEGRDLEVFNIHPAHSPHSQIALISSVSARGKLLHSADFGNARPANAFTKEIGLSLIRWFQKRSRPLARTAYQYRHIMTLIRKFFETTKKSVRKYSADLNEETPYLFIKTPIDSDDEGWVTEDEPELQLLEYSFGMYQYYEDAIN